MASGDELKLENDYEDKLTEEFRRNCLFEGRDPEKLTTFITHDVASAAIEESLLDTFELGDELLWEFMVTRLVGTGTENKPSPRWLSAPHSPGCHFSIYMMSRKREKSQKK